jgi:eukaryotic-like serine/threonine-protein kinase
MRKQDPISDNFPRKFGKYHLLGPLAQGGMGALYLAITGERGLERLTVIKTVLPHLADKEYLARFRDEAKVVVKLSHGNLVPVFDAGMVSGELFLAMDFVEGKDLRAVWNRCANKQVAFPVDIAVYIVKELCRGLHYAHSFRDLELVHRDVSPPNVLLSFDGEVKLTDFGLASSTLKLEKTAPGIIYGKVAYMSPEQARGEPLDGRSDLYAAAIILWELLTGRQLFPPSKEQPQDLVKRAQDPVVDPPSTRAPRVPPELDAICLKALAPRREDRYDTGEAFRGALAGWLAQAAPTTDASRLGGFVAEIFREDLERDRVARQELIEKARNRARLTLPPTDELRQLLDHHQQWWAGGGRSGTMPIGAGRRAEDLGGPADRRQGERRAGSRFRRGEGVAVDVPRPKPGGQTFVTTEGAPGALAHQEQSLGEQEPSQVIGTVIDDRYRVLELIGEGGMGRVYLAEHVEIGKRVAVKILHPVYGRMPDLVERFRREARAASRIGHPHIVDVTDSGTTEDDSVYFVMEYLEGVELAHVIEREGALDLSRALQIATQICRALAAAHAVGVIHRDLKPENVFLTAREGSSDFVKVLDFGIAKSAETEQARTDRLTHPGMAMGTPEYMAPEQAAGRPADARTDVYAVGAILYEMLTGTAPYSGENFMEILTKKATQEPPPVSELRPGLPEAVVDLVERAMARRPRERPPSMEAFEYDLTKCLQGRGVAVAKVLGMPIDVAGGAPVVGGTRRGSATPAGGSAGEKTRVDSSSGSASSPTGRTEPVPPARHSWVSELVWVVLGACVVFGVGVVVYVTLGEQTARTRPVAAVDVPDASIGTGELEFDPPRSPPTAAAVVTPSAPEATAELAQPLEAGAADAGVERERANGPAQAAVAATPVRAGGDERHNPAPKSNGGPPLSRAQAAQLLRGAHAFEAELKWDAARRNYERVARGRYNRALGLLGLAKVAFETKQVDEAIRYAEKALNAGGGDAARMLLGHAHFKNRDYGKAASYYEAVLKRKPSHKEAQHSLREAQRRLASQP